jgi:hypothetical protein
VSDSKDDFVRLWEAGMLAVMCATVMVLCLWLNDRRLDAAESRILDLENKPCLMTGAHTGCKR